MQFPFYFFSSLFPFRHFFWPDWQKFLAKNYLSLPTARVTKIGLVSLKTLSNVSVYALLVVISNAGGYYVFDVRVEFKAHLELFSMLYQLNSCAGNSSLLCQLCRCQKSFITPIITIANIYINCNYCNDYFQLFQKYIHLLLTIISFICSQLAVIYTQLY